MNGPAPHRLGGKIEARVLSQSPAFLGGVRCRFRIEEFTCISQTIYSQSLALGSATQIKTFRSSQITAVHSTNKIEVDRHSKLRDGRKVMPRFSNWQRLGTLLVKYDYCVGPWHSPSMGCGGCGPERRAEIANLPVPYVLSYKVECGLHSVA